ncbi:MAG: restriction endonuclease subunit S [Patescibacteria group bacterium]
MAGTKMTFTSSKNWKTVDLSELAAFSNGKSSPDRLESGQYPVYGANGIIGFTDIKNSDKESIIIGRVGSYCGSLYFSENESWVTDNAIICKAKDNSDPKFIFYLLNTLGLNSRAAGSGQPLINQSILGSIEVIIPQKKEEQKEVAAVLGCLDDKIELLRRENKTLASIAQAIFKEWFVDFRFPGHEKVKMIDGLPEEWKVGKLGEFCNISIGRTPPRKEEEWFSKYPSDVKWISIKDMGTSGAYIFNTSEYLTQEAVDNFNIPVIPENTVIISFKMTLGRVAITTEEMLSNEAIAHLKPKDNLSPEFLYLTMKNFDFNSMGSTSSIASAVNSQSIKDMEIVAGGDHIMKLFSQITSPIFERLKNGAKEIQTLSRLRDDLLNKIFNV